MQQLIFVVLCAAELTDNFTKRVILRRAETGKVVNDEVVDCEYIGKLDVERGLRPCEEVVELVNLELSFSRTDVDHVGPDVLQAVDSFSHVAVEGLEVKVVTTKQFAHGYLTKHLGNSTKVSVHDG